MRLLVVCCGLAVEAGAIHFFGIGVSKGAHAQIDFDVFHMAGNLVWQGRAGDAYDGEVFGAAQRAITARHGFMPWTYPPPFDLVVAALALLPLGIAYLVFVVPALLAYLATLDRITGKPPIAATALVLVPILVTIICGQNGLLTGTLAGLAAIGLLGRHRWAGVPLGLMIIKPHLVVGLALYALIDRRWGVIGIAAFTAAACCAAATLVLGTDIWPAFLAGVEQASRDLSEHFYPLHRMASPFAALRSLGVAPPVAFAAQAAVAVAALGMVVVARLRLDPRAAVGVAILAGLLVSPYAYDYDLPVFGIGLALVLPAFVARAQRWEVGAASAMIVVAGGMGIAQVMADPGAGGSAGHEVPAFVTLSGLLLVAAFGLIGGVLIREPASRAALAPAE